MLGSLRPYVVGLSLFSLVSCGGDPPRQPPSSGGEGGEATGGDGGSGGGGSGGSTGGRGGAGGRGGSGGSAGTGGSAGAGGASGGSGGGSAGTGGGADAGAMPDPVPTDPTKFRYSKLVKMDTSAVGANVMGDVTNYPVAVVLNAMNFDFSQAKEKGEDLRFTKMDGSPLPYAIEDWDKAGQWAAVWVKIDTVKGNTADQTFKMLWGNAGASDAGNSKAVFDNGYLGVYHLNEDGSATPDAYKDSSTYEAHGTGMNMAAGSRVDARIGKGTRLTNSRMDWKGQWIKVDGPKVIDMFNATAERSITVSAWARASSFPGHSTIGGYETVFSKGDTSWTLQKFSFNSSWESCTKAPGSGHYCAISRTNRTMVNVWFHFTLVITRSNLTQFINGAQDGRTGNAGRVSQHPFGIGQQTQSLMGKREWDGIIDEVRVSSVDRGANWIKLDYESQKEGQKFLTFGEAAQVP
jgi:hypothetical protein